MPDEYTIAEIQRSLARLEAGLSELRTEVRDRHEYLTGQVSAAVGPMSVLIMRMDNAERDLRQVCGDIKRLDADSEDGKMQGARIGAVVVVVGVIGQFAMWAVSTFWKH